MAERRYLRTARVQIGDSLEVVGTGSEGLRIGFQVNRTLNESKDSTVQLTNLSPATAGRIERGEVLTLTAGYVGQDGVLIVGPVDNVNSRREGQERITTLTVSPGADRTEQLFRKSYDEAATVHIVLGDIAQEMGVRLGDLSVVPNDPTPNFASTASVTAALTGLLRQREIAWTEEDGVLEFTPADAAPGAGGTGTFIVNELNGMKGTPTPTDTGAQVTTLLDPRFRIRSGIFLQSEAVSGTFRVTEIAHKGSTWDGPFETELTMVRPGAESL